MIRPFMFRITFTICRLSVVGCLCLIVEPMLPHDAKQINDSFAAHSEWLYSYEGKTQSLTREEIELRFEFGKLILCLPTDEGFTFWRVKEWKAESGELVFQVSKNFGKDSKKIEFTPRALSKTLTENINQSRQERAINIATLSASFFPKTEIEKVGLSAGIRRGTVGRYARIILKSFNQRIAVTTDVAQDEEINVNAFLSSSLLWFQEQQERKKEANKLWLILQKENIESLVRRMACLCADLRGMISLFEIEDDILTKKQKLEIGDLWLTVPDKISQPQSNIIWETSQNIVNLAPDSIDVVRSRRGETLRFYGLPFCRVRTTMKRQRVWFGVEADKRRELNQQTLSDFDKLISELQTHRTPETKDKRHDYYRLASEAWLESILRRDISRLDPGLIIAPLHAQFRPDNSKSGGARPLDLLALRKDGRLVVIELKTSEDREHIFQGIDYWRQIELHRRAGNIEYSKLFRDKEISDEPPLVYLVAPLLSFHRKFKTLACMIDPQIEIYRFDLNEDWRFGISVARRTRINSSE